MFKVSGRNDVILSSKSATSYLQGARAGIGMKSKIEPHDFIQAQVECLLIAINSFFPVMQVFCSWQFIIGPTHLSCSF